MVLDGFVRSMNDSLLVLAGEPRRPELTHVEVLKRGGQWQYTDMTALCHRVSGLDGEEAAYHQGRSDVRKNHRPENLGFISILVRCSIASRNCCV